MSRVLSYEVTEFPTQDFEHDLNTKYLAVFVWVNGFLTAPDVRRLDDNTIRVGIVQPSDDAQVVIVAEDAPTGEQSGNTKDKPGFKPRGVIDSILHPEANRD